MDVISSFAARFERTREEELSLEEYLAECKRNPVAYATAASPGAGSKWKSIVRASTLRSNQIGISPDGVVAIQRSLSSGRIDRQNPTAHWGKLSGSATNANTSSGNAVIEIDCVFDAVMCLSGWVLDIESPVLNGSDARSAI